MNGVKSGHHSAIQRRSSCLLLYCLQWKKSCSYQGKLLIFFPLLQQPLERLSEAGMNESWKLESPLMISCFWMDILYFIFISISVSPTIAEVFNLEDIVIWPCLTANTFRMQNLMRKPNFRLEIFLMTSLSF